CARDGAIFGLPIIRNYFEFW
nr:immunoglobulin heavy chain junction region [Macaca mulatta]MOV38935.1 immunoglobulin heavy chain junction region [Macaca mulatta]MOV39816.1 immunoglobulin heavy chain junction region [Macaca mulatta]MOV40044.1 immunoglobulin heavy chain junction region [Macaca mulatta]MOV42180.1 immunoglobulin heavy chain junction region [Macaca mulatta]